MSARSEKSKRELAALDGARSAENDPIAKAKYDSEFARKSAVLKRREARLSEHLKATGLLPDSSRVRVDGFGRSVSQKAVHANKKYLLDKAEKNDIMKAEQQSDLGLLKQKLRSDDRVSKEYYAAVRGKFSRGSDAAKKRSVNLFRRILLQMPRLRVLHVMIPNPKKYI